MIIEQDDGELLVDFADWTGGMAALSFILSTRPAPDDMPPELIYSYVIGIDRLRSAGGDKAVEALYEVARDLDWRPCLHTVVTLGKRVIRAQRELAKVVRGTARTRSSIGVRVRSNARRQRQEVRPRIEEKPWRVAAREALATDRINAWETSFLQSLLDHYRSLSPKQSAALEAICARASRSNDREEADDRK
jgi:hypothetical protein